MTASDYLVVERLEAKVEELRAEMDQRMAAYIEYQERDEAEIKRLTTLLAASEALKSGYLDEIERLKAKIAIIEEAALAAYRYHMLGYKDADAFNANVMLDHMNKLGEVL